MKRRIVVTGLGVVSSIGIGKDKFWKNLISGTSGISDITTFDVSKYSSKKGAEVKNFISENFFNKKELRQFGRASQFSVSATKLAFKDAKITPGKDSNIGVVIGTTLADAHNIEQIDKYWITSDEENIWSENIVKYPGYNLSNSVSYYFKLKGGNFVIPTACAAGNYSIGLIYDLIKKGKLDIGVAGGADPLGRINFTGFNRLVAMAPEKCQPFDKNRKGMMVGEGSGVIVLEDMQHALKRGAAMYAEVLGYGLSCDAYNMTIPSIEGIEKVMEKAIKNSDIKKSEVGYICAHGTGTQANDRAECSAIRKVFGESINNVAVSSMKSMLGHTMGAASAIEAIGCCLAVQKGIIPPTINFETPDPECDIDCVPNVSKEKELKVVLNNSFAFGGNNACLVLGKVKP